MTSCFSFLGGSDNKKMTWDDAARNAKSEASNEKPSALHPKPAKRGPKPAPRGEPGPGRNTIQTVMKEPEEDPDAVQGNSRKGSGSSGSDQLRSEVGTKIAAGSKKLLASAISGSRAAASKVAAAASAARDDERRPKLSKFLTRKATAASNDTTELSSYAETTTEGRNQSDIGVFSTTSPVDFTPNNQPLDKEDVSGYPAPLPRVLLSLKEKLIREDGLHTEGIFRIPAENDEKAKYMKELQRREYELDGCSSYCAANLILRFFNEMDEPLLARIPDPILDIAENDPTKNLQGILDKVVGALNSEKKALFLWLIDLSVDITDNSSTNLMDANALTSIIVPTIFPIDYGTRFSAIRRSVSTYQDILMACIKQRRSSH